jgi:hypothetical protein
MYRNENVESTNDPQLFCFLHSSKFAKQRYTTRRFPVQHMYKYSILLFELAVGIKTYASLSSEHFKAIPAQLKWGTVSERYWSLKYKYSCWWAISIPISRLTDATCNKFLLTCICLSSGVYSVWARSPYRVRDVTQWTKTKAITCDACASCCKYGRYQHWCR